MPLMKSGASAMDAAAGKTAGVIAERSSAAKSGGRLRARMNRYAMSEDREMIDSTGAAKSRAVRDDSNRRGAVAKSADDSGYHHERSEGRPEVRVTHRAKGPSLTQDDGGGSCTTYVSRLNGVKPRAS